MANSGELRRESESLLTAAQDNAVRTNYVIAKIDKLQQNSRCRLCSDRDETINDIINECSKLIQKEYITRHTWLRKMVYCELCKKFKFDHSNKLCMLKQESVPENKTPKIIWDFEIQT